MSAAKYGLVDDGIAPSPLFITFFFALLSSSCTAAPAIPGEKEEEDDDDDDDDDDEKAGEAEQGAEEEESKPEGGLPAVPNSTDPEGGDRAGMDADLWLPSAVSPKKRSTPYTTIASNCCPNCLYPLEVASSAGVFRLRSILERSAPLCSSSIQPFPKPLAAAK